MSLYVERWCPKCGSTRYNSEVIGNGEPRLYWCMTCGHAQHKAFPNKKPKHLDFEAVEKRIASLKTGELKP